MRQIIASSIVWVQVEGYHRRVISLCESEREKVHDDGGNTLSVGKGKKKWAYNYLHGIYS